MRQSIWILKDHERIWMWFAHDCTRTIMYMYIIPYNSHILCWLYRHTTSSLWGFWLGECLHVGWWSTHPQTFEARTAEYPVAGQPWNLIPRQKSIKVGTCVKPNKVSNFKRPLSHPFERISFWCHWKLHSFFGSPRKHRTKPIIVYSALAGPGRCQWWVTWKLGGLGVLGLARWGGNSLLALQGLLPMASSCRASNHQGGAGEKTSCLAEISETSGPSKLSCKGMQFAGPKLQEAQVCSFFLWACCRLWICEWACASTEPSQPQCWAFFLDLNHVVLSTLTLLNLGSSIHNPSSCWDLYLRAPEVVAFLDGSIKMAAASVSPHRWTVPPISVHRRHHGEAQWRDHCRSSSKLRWSWRSCHVLPCPAPPREGLKQKSQNLGRDLRRGLWLRSRWHVNGMSMAIGSPGHQLRTHGRWQQSQQLCCFPDLPRCAGRLSPRGAQEGPTSIVCHRDAECYARCTECWRAALIFHFSKLISSGVKCAQGRLWMLHSSAEGETGEMPWKGETWRNQDAQASMVRRTRSLAPRP